MPFLPGFDESWQDAPDYILGITREIWEERRIERLTGYYADDVVVRSPASVVQGNDGIISATQMTLVEFPDRELLGEDVIWCQTGYKSFLSSHRLYCTATHEGPGVYGAPTGKRLEYRILADCWCRGNAVVEEWLVRDQGAIVRQMGADILDWTRGLIAREGGPETCVQPYTPANEIPSRYLGPGNDNEWGHTLADLLSRMMAAEMSVITRHYDRAAELAYPGHVTGSGWPEAERFWMALRAAFPSARFDISHAVGLDEPLSSPRAAVRWVLTGRHDGWGMFGAPTGAEVFIMGITHAEFGPRGLRREWTLIDETAIWKQILLQTGAVD
jgi:predicted ester cyclase